MCGIAGFFQPPLDVSEYPSTIIQMVGRIEHRGPDGLGYFIDDNCAIGAARLSIIDHQLGTQPISAQHDRYWICYNGEIYNYKELRIELEALGQIFHTQSDTEVVLQSWITWGEACLTKLNGGFAFAIYDRKTTSLVLARDRFGKRPLFYVKKGKGLLFASEMKAFLAFPSFHFEQDTEQLSSILAQWTPLPEQTGFSNINSLPMGEYLLVKSNEIIRRRYTSLSLHPTIPISNEGEAIEIVQKTLEESVRLRMRSDVGVGVYLSGGLDSAIIAMLASKVSGQKIKTFSIKFEDAQFDESAEQAEISSMLDTEHESVHITDGDITKNFPEAIFHAEIPAFRSAFVPMFMLSKKTSEKGTKVVLSGEGADEAFLGYDIFKETQLRSKWSELDDSKRRMELSKLYPHLDHFGPQDLEAIVGLYKQFSSERLSGLFSHELRFQNGRFCTRLMREPGDPFRAISSLVEREPSFKSLSPIQKAQWLEFHTLLPGYLLSTQGDRMSLAHGVENRCPFLDQSVVDVASSINHRFDDGFEEKRILRRAFQNNLPESVIKKRKFPYRSPDSAAFAAKPPDYLELLQSDAELSKLPYLHHQFARALTKKVLTNPPNTISTKENQAFIFLISIVLLHHFFVEQNGINRFVTKSSTQIKAVDMRTNYN